MDGRETEARFSSWVLHLLPCQLPYAATCRPRPAEPWIYGNGPACGQRPCDRRENLPWVGGLSFLGPGPESQGPGK